MATEYDLVANVVDCVDVGGASRRGIFSHQNSWRASSPSPYRTFGGSGRTGLGAAKVARSASTAIRRYLWLADAADIAAPEGWSHARTLVRVTAERLDATGRVTASESRYFISSRHRTGFTPHQWLLVIRRHWGVELCHQTLDQAFAEDGKPWIRANATGMLAVLVLRRVIYTLLSFYRSVTLRDASRVLPWKQLLRQIELTLTTATEVVLSGLRGHTVALLE